MGRNKLIYALAGRTVVIASDLERGGTWSGAKEAIKQGLGQVLVWRGDGEGQGNSALEALGATPFAEVSDLSDDAPVSPPHQRSRSRSS